MRWRPCSSASSGALATAVAAGLLTACGPAPPAAVAPGSVYIAGTGQLRAIGAGALQPQGQLSLLGPVAAATVDGRRHRLDVLVGGDAPALLAIDVAAPSRLRVVARRGLAMAPKALQLDAGDQRAYVLGDYGTGPGKLLAIDLDSGNIVGAAMTGAQPVSLALSGDGALLAVANAGAPSISVFSVPALKLLGTIALDAAPSRIVGLPYGRKAFALCGDTVGVLDLDGRNLLTYLPVGPRAQRLLAKPDGGEVYVSNASGSVSVIDTSTNEVAATMPAGLGAGAMAVARDGSALYVANATAGTISVLSLADRTMTAMVHVGDGPNLLQLSANGEFLFAADAASDDLAVVRTNRDPANPNSLVTLLSSPPQATMLVAGSQ